MASPSEFSGVCDGCDKWAPALIPHGEADDMLCERCVAKAAAHARGRMCLDPDCEKCWPINERRAV